MIILNLLQGWSLWQLNDFYIPSLKTRNANFSAPICCIMHDKFQVHLYAKSKPILSNHSIDFYLKLYVARHRMLHWWDLSIAYFGIQVIFYGHILCTYDGHERHGYSVNMKYNTDPFLFQQYLANFTCGTSPPEMILYWLWPKL